jgi:glycosyltransferase involved in cell wall biosynthesis
MTSQEKKPAIWTISYWYPPNFSGAGIQAHRENRLWVQQGLAVTVLAAGVSTAHSQRGKTVDLEGVRIRYVPVIPFPTSSSHSRFRRLQKILFSISSNLSFLSFALMCSWILLNAGQSNDIVRFEGPGKFTILPVTMARLKGLHPIIRMSLLGSDDPYSICEEAKHGHFLQYLSLVAFHLAEGSVAICSAMLASCQKAGIATKKVTYIPYGIDIDVYQPVVGGAGNAKICQDLGLDIYKRYILFVGSAIERKGIDVLIDAFIQLHQKMERVELLIVGPDRFDRGAFYDAFAHQKMVDACKEKLAAAHCSEFVHWTGEVENVQEYMQAADLFCLPTRQEGFGLVIIEAMASGLPVVVAQLEGVTTDIINSPQTGVIIPGYDYRNYADAMIDILNNPQKAKQMGLAARARSVTFFSLKHSLRQWEALFQKLAKE